MAKMTVKMCACAGSGDVLTIQELLHICSEHYTPAPVIIIYLVRFLKNMVYFYIVICLIERRNF